MAIVKAGRNKTIDTPLSEGQIYLDRCITITQAQLNLSAVMDKTIIGDMLEICTMLPAKSIDLIIADPPYNLTKSFNGTIFAKKNNADYEEYSEQEYEQFLWKADIEMQEYLDVEHEMCGLLVPDIPVEFSYVVSKVLYVRGTDNILEKKSKEFSVFDVYKFITQAQPTEDEKAFEKQCIKERLKLDSYTCQFCGARKSDKVKIGVAYVIKPSSGGVVSVDNMITLCQNCTGKLNHM